VIAPTLPDSRGGPPISVQRRSFPQARADDVEQLLDDVGLGDPVAIVGSSGGGVTAL
jgi:pimeloyl-ACP methyl ester carboxylesterase